MSVVPSTVDAMSTTIDIYPSTERLPLVEETRARTQELFERLLDRRGIASTIEVKAFHLNSSLVRLPRITLYAWHKGLDLDSDTGSTERGLQPWPSCLAVEAG